MNMFSLIPTTVEMELGGCDGTCQGCQGCLGCDGEEKIDPGIKPPVN